MKILAIIPARMGSSRFPGKPLKQLAGMPMVGHVYTRVSKSDILEKTVVATCDDEIADYVSRQLGGEAVMTSSVHERASDRCAEALIKLEESDGVKYDVVVMVQGDEPMTHPDMIAEAVNPFISDPSIEVTNLLGKITSEQEFNDRNCIKVVCDLNGRALYFSREPIPSQLKKFNTLGFKQVCVIAFRRDFLLRYINLEPTPLEIAESIDMLRVLEHGSKVVMVPTLHKSYAVDTPGDLERVEKEMKRKSFV